jgi:hypothetical protein
VAKRQKTDVVVDEYARAMAEPDEMTQEESEALADDNAADPGTPEEPDESSVVGSRARRAQHWCAKFAKPVAEVEQCPVRDFCISVAGEEPCEFYQTADEALAAAEAEALDPTEPPAVRAPMQMTLDEQMFPLIRSVRVNITGGLDHNLATLRQAALPVGLQPGHDVRMVLHGYIVGAGVKFSREGGGKSGSINLFVTEMESFEVAPTRYAAMAVIDPPSKKKDADEAPDPQYGDDFDPSLCPEQPVGAEAEVEPEPEGEADADLS